MKLRIKETGELLEDVKFIDTTLHKITIQYLDCGVLRECVVKNLSDVEEIKDYEEPKWYWYINCFGKVLDTLYNGDERDEQRKLIGNYFLTKEEAEKAVEKLKAWKRLKDKGFRFGGWKRDKRFWGDYTIEAQDYTTCDDKDLDLLFGGEE